MTSYDFCFFFSPRRLGGLSEPQPTLPHVARRGDYNQYLDADNDCDYCQSIMIILRLMWMKMIMLIIDYQCWWWWFSGDLLLCFHAPRGLPNQCNRLQSFRFQDNHDHDYDQHKVLSDYSNPLKSRIYDIGPSVISAAMGILWMSSTLWNSDSGLCRIDVSTLS